VSLAAFCARTTAQLNALNLEPWASGPNGADLPSSVARLVQYPRAADFAPIHIVGEQFALCVDNSTKVPFRRSTKQRTHSPKSRTCTT